MMRNFLFLGIAISIFACKPQPQTPTTFIPTPNGLQVKPAQNNAQMVSSVKTATTQAINPAHGQPGHRCDIAVGAPLPATPATTPATTTQVQPQTVAPSLAAMQKAAQEQAAKDQVKIATANAKGAHLNPPHGQPNHRCDIAVGAPLNSKPNAVAQTAAPKVVSPAPNSTSAAAPLMNEKGQMLNPAHGQPNHRCDIAVGAPLPTS